MAGAFVLAVGVGGVASPGGGIRVPVVVVGVVVTGVAGGRRAAVVVVVCRGVGLRRDWLRLLALRLNTGGVMAVAVKIVHSKSWLSREFGPVAAARLRERLLERCKGEKGLFLTLTYDREKYDSPQDLYRRAAEERHVRLFVRELERKLRVDLTGRWLCKLEFQQGGWVHWHLLVLGVEFISHDILSDAWGMGFVWVRRMSRTNICYVCKYVAKDGEIPAFLYLERSRSVRIVRVSPGFWLKTCPRGSSERRELMPFYRTVGQVLESSADRVVCQNLETGVFKRSLRGRPGVLVLRDLLSWPTACVVSCSHGWLVIDGVSPARVEAALYGSPSGGPAGPPGEARPGGGAGGLHLNSSLDPHKGGVQVDSDGFPIGGSPVGRWCDWYLEGWARGWV